MGCRASPWPLTTPASSEPSPRTRVLAPPFGFSPFDRGGAAAVTMAAACHRSGVPFIRSNLLAMTVIVIFAALANRLPRVLF